MTGNAVPRFIVIGITDSPQPFFPPAVAEMISQGTVFSGGKRHHEIVAPMLPCGAEWIDITVPLDAVFERYASIGGKTADGPHGGDGARRSIIVFASGDPLFFGFANTIRRKMPQAEVLVFPSFNSLQILAHRLLMPYHDMRIVSLTGRPWPEFDRALIERTAKMGVLTDREHTPAAMAQRMLDYGYSDFVMHVGEHLGHPAQERITSLSLEEAARSHFAYPNCVILTGTPAARRFGLPDSEFALLNGREKMITKMPVRLLTLQALDLPRRHVFWDIGFCTGSVSIEARLQFPHLHVEAFEIRPECEAIMAANARRHGTPGISVRMGDFCQVCCHTIAAATGAPDAVFIGGHGGRLKDIMAKVSAVLAGGGVIVMNSVKAPAVATDSHRLFCETCQALGLQQLPPLRVVVDGHHPIEILKCIKQS